MAFTNYECKKYATKCNEKNATKCKESKDEKISFCLQSFKFLINQTDTNF